MAKDKLLVNQEISPVTGLTGDSVFKEDPLLKLQYQRDRLSPPEFGSRQLPGVTSKSYDEGIIPRDLEYGQLGYKRASNQGFGAELSNALYQAGAEIIGGTLEGFGYITDPETYGNFLDKTTFDSGNLLSELGKQIKESSREQAPVFVNPDIEGSFAPWKHEWWMTNLPSIASTLSLMIPSGAVVKGISSLGKLSKISKALGLVDDASKVTKLGIGARGVGQAVVSRHMESMMEASQVADEIFKSNLNKGMTEEEALKNASLAATITYRRNWAMLAQDLPQYLLLNRFLAGSKATMGMNEARANNIPVVGALFNKSYNVAKDILGEGFEEGYQYMMAEEAKYIAEKSLYPEKKVPFGERFGEYLKSGEMWTSFTMGMLGAATMQTAGKALNDYIMRSKGIESPEDIRIADTNSWAPKINKAAKDYLDAIREFGPDSIDAEISREELLSDLVVSSAVSGNIENLKSFIERINKPDSEDANLFGVTPEAIDMLQGGVEAGTFDNIDKLVSKIEKNYQLYEAGKLDSVDQAVNIAKQEYLADRLEEYASKFEAQANENLTNSNYSKLSPKSQELQDLNIKLRGLNIIKKITQEELKSAKKNNANKETIKSIENRIATINNDISETLKETKSKDKSRTKEEKESDDKILAILDKEADYNEYTKNKSKANILNETSNLRRDIANYYRTNWKDIVSKEEKDDSAVNEELNKDESSTPKKDDLVEVPLTEDILNTIKSNYPEYSGNIGESFIGKIKESDPDNPLIHTVSILDEGGVETGLEVILDQGSFIIVGNENSTEQSEFDPVSDEEVPEEDIIDESSNEDFSVVKNSIKVVYSAGKGSKVEVFDNELNSYVSDPKNKLNSASVYFGIDLTEKLLDRIASNYGNTDKIKKLLRQLSQHIYGVNKLNSDQIESLLNTPISSTRFFYDVIPVGLNIWDKGKQRNSKNVYLYESGKPESQDNERTLRLKVLRDLLNGKTSYIKGGLRKANSGFYNSTKTNKKVNEALQTESKDIQLGVAKNNNVIFTDPDGSDYPVEFKANPGNVVAFTNKTSNGEVVPVKLNPKKISREDAEIIWTAINTIFLPKDKGGSGLSYAAPWPDGDNRVEGLSAFEVIKLLVNFGEENTSLEYAKRNYALPEYLRSKQLYYKNGLLYFGASPTTGEPNSISLSLKHPDDKKIFIDWITKNKNYSTMLKSKTLGIELNKPFKKAFRIGKITHDGKGKYSEFLINNEFVQSNVEVFENSNTVFKTPLLVLSTNDNLYHSKEKSPKDDKSKQGAGKVTDKVKTETTTPKATSAETKEKIKAQSKVTTLTSFTQLSNLPVGTVLYEEIDIPISDKEVQRQRFNVFQIGYKNGTKIFSTTTKELSLLNGVEIEANAKVIYDEILRYYGLPNQGVTFLKVDVTNVKEEVSKKDEIDVPLFNEDGTLNDSHYSKEEKTTSEPVKENTVDLQDTKSNVTTEDIKEDQKASENNPGGFMFEDDDAPRQATKTEGEYQVQNWEKEVEGWFRSRFGDVPVIMTDKLIQLARGGAYGWALYRHSGITLMKAAETGTIYHEAFHRVSMGYLTYQQRVAIYKEASSKYSEELKLYKSELIADGTLKPGDSLQGKHIEEFLAEKFREYVIKHQEARELLKIVGNYSSDDAAAIALYEANPGLQSIYNIKFKIREARELVGKKSKGRVLKFIEDLFDFLYKFFTGETRLTTYDIDHLFNMIDNGKFKKSTVLTVNKNNLKDIGLPRIKVRGRILENVNTSEQLNNIVRGIGAMLINSNNIDDINSIESIKWSPIEVAMNDIVTRAKEVNNNRLTDLYTEVLQDLNSKDSIVKQLVDDYLLNIGIKTKDRTIKLIQEDYESDPTNKNADYDTGIERYDKASYELDPKNNVLTSVKFLVATLYHAEPDPKFPGSFITRDPFTNMRYFTDFNRTWNMLVHDLHNAKDIKEMLSILKSKPNIYEYSHLINKLERGTSLLRTQFEVAMKLHRHMFVNMKLNRKYDPVSNRYEEDIQISQSDLRTTINEMVLLWNQMFILSDAVSRPDFNINSDYLLSVQNDYKTLVKKLGSTKTLDKPDVDNFVVQSNNLLKRIGVDVPEDAIYNYISGMKSDEFNKNLKNFIAVELDKIFNSFLNSLAVKKDKIENLFIDESFFRNLSQSYINVRPELLVGSILGPGGALYWSYSLNSYVTDIVREINTDSDKLDNIQSKLYSKHSYIADRLRENKAKLQVLTFEGVYSKASDGKDYHDITSDDDYLAKLYFLNNDMLPFPTLADRKTFYLLKGVNKLDSNFKFNDNNKIEVGDDVVDLFYDYFLDELERVNYNNKLLEEYNKEKDVAKKRELQRSFVANYHFGLDGQKDNNGLYTKKSLNAGNAYKFSHFPSFNKYIDKDELSDVEFVKSKLRETLNDLVNNEVDFAYNKGYITTNKDGKFTYGPRNSTVNQKFNKKYGTANYGSRAMIADFAINTMMINIEIEKLFLGDPAFFKSDKKSSLSGNPITHVDRIKRSSVLTSTGTNLAEKVEGFSDLELRSTYNSAVLKTQKFESLNIKSLRSTYEELLAKRYSEQYPELSLQEVQAKSSNAAKHNLSAYESMDPTDAQVYISPAMYRSIAIRLGEWSNIKEEAYNLLVSDEDLSLEQEQTMLKVVMQPLKLVHFSLSQQGDLNVPIYDKMSLTPLYRRLFKAPSEIDKAGSKVLYDVEELMDRMEAKGKYKGLQPIHMFKFDTAVKSGASESSEYYKDPYSKTEINNLSDVTFITQKFKYLRRQLVTDPHENNSTKVGTQVIKIALSNVIKTGSYKVDGKTINGSDLIKLINSSLSSLSSIGKRRVESKLGYNSNSNTIDWKIFSEILVDEARKAGMSDNIIDGLEINDNGELTIPIDAMADRKWIQSRVISLISKEVVDRIMPGGQFIQMSNFGIKKIGTSSDLGFVSTNINGDAYKAMECRVSIRLFKDIIPNYDNISFEEKVKFLKDNDLDEIIAYRIPTQGLSSIVALKVKEFIQETVGDTIILPDEFTALTGSDFDIDKLFVMRYNYTNKSDGSLKRVPYLDNENSSVDERYKNKIWEEFYINTQYFSKESYDRVKNIKSERYQAYKDDNKEKGIELSKELNQILNTEIRPTLLENRLILPLSEFKNLSIEEQNTEAALQNKLMSGYLSVLKNPLHFIESVEPLGNLKDTLQNIRSIVMKNRETIGSEDLESITPSFMNDIKDKYTGGKFGVAPFALSKAHHVLAQMFNLRIKMEGSAKIIEIDPSLTYFNPETNDYELFNIIGKDGINISEWLSVLIDAHVDIAKDPYIVDLNVNKATYDILNFMLRSGFGESSFWFLSQPVVVDYAAGQLGKGSELYMAKNFMVDDSLNKYISKTGLEAEELKEIIYNQNYINEILKPEELKKTFEDGALDPEEFAIRQVAYHFIMKNFKTLGNNLLKVVMSNRVDTKGYGSNLVDIELFIKSMEEVVKADVSSNEFNSMIYPDFNDPTFDNSASFIHNYTVNSLYLAKKLLSNMTIYSTNGFIGLRDMLLKNIGYTKLDNKTHNAISDELFAGIIGKYFSDLGYNPAQLVRMFNSKKGNSTADLFFKIKNKYPDLKNNRLMNYIIPFKYESGQVGSYIKIPVDRISDSWSKNEIIRAWEDLYFYTYKDGEIVQEVRNFAIELFVYSYYSSGFKKRLKSFFDFIPASMIIDMKFNDFVRDEFKEFKNNSLAKLAEHEPVLEEIIANNTNLSFTFIPSSKNDNYVNILKNKGGDIIYFELSSENITRVGYGSNMEPIPSKYVMDKETDILYKNIGMGIVINPTTKARSFSYGYVAINKKGLTEPKGITLREYYMDISSIPSNNILSISESEAQSNFMKNNTRGLFVPRDQVVIDENISNNEMIENIQDVEYTEDETRALPESKEDVALDALGDIPYKSSTPTMTYAGIGSRETPKEVLDQMSELAMELAHLGYTLNTGDAKGADLAFRRAAPNDKVNVFTPADATDETRNIARATHPNPEAVDKLVEVNKQKYGTDKYNPWNLLARNTNQVFGRDLRTPVDFVIAWTKGGKLVGGTAQALRMAQMRDIPIINLADKNWRSQLDNILSSKQDLPIVVAESITPSADKLSTLEKPLKIYVDGSDIKGTGQIGYGAVVNYATTDYELSGISDKNEFAEKYGLSKEDIVHGVSNPTMELLGTVETLKLFENTSEHLNILQDYEGVKEWLEGRWKAKKSYIAGLVKEGQASMERIKNNGGSVTFTWIKGHTGHEYNEKADVLAKSRDIKNTFKDLLELNLGSNSNNISNEESENRNKECK